MPDPQVDQKLAAILVPDVAGYSRLMEADERATVATLDAYRAVFREYVTVHGGRIVDAAGDSMLAVVESVVEADQCEVEVREHGCSAARIYRPRPDHVAVA